VKAYGGIETQLHSFFTSALNGDELSASYLDYTMLSSGEGCELDRAGLR